MADNIHYVNTCVLKYSRGAEPMKKNLMGDAATKLMKRTGAEAL